LLNESNQEYEVTYIDQGELLIIQISLSLVYDESDD
jgi:hypothetical protein